MKTITIFSILLFVSNLAYADSPDLLSLLNKQVTAFNQQDVKKLVGNVSEDMKYYYLTADELIIETSGKAAFEQAMINYFRSGHTPYSTIESHVIDGTRISFREVVSHLDKQGKKITSSAMGIYQYKDDKITRAWYFID